MHVFENKILLVKIYPALIIKLERKVKKMLMKFLKIVFTYLITKEMF